MNSRKAFTDCIKAAANGTGPQAGDTAMLSDIVATYPWFTTARMLCSEASGCEDELLSLHYSAYPRPLGRLASISLDEFGVAAKLGKRKSAKREPEDAIEKFLQKGEYRIVPDSRATEEDAAAESGSFDLSDDFVSEELAEIYLAQGLNRQAKEIYERLSLLNPEKSIYFAEIIAGIPCAEGSSKN